MSYQLLFSIYETMNYQVDIKDYIKCKISRYKENGHRMYTCVDRLVLLPYTVNTVPRTPNFFLCALKRNLPLVWSGRL